MINLAEQTRLMDTYNHLKAAGVEVYFPGQKKGECKKPYTVVRDAGTSPYTGYSSAITLYELLCYVPKDQYSTLQVYANTVKEVMKGLWPMLIPTRYESAPFYDDTVDAHMTYIQYRNMKYTPKQGGSKNGLEER